jgi:phosphoglycolate phosphatase-like HAD superfamily hydrolase
MKRLGPFPFMSESMLNCDRRFAGPVEFSAEFLARFKPRPEIRHVLFDFDGTLSLVRQGWPDVMVPMFVEMLPRKSGESDADLERLVYDDIMRLNGKQTIYQMMQLEKRVAERGGAPRDPLWYKLEYLRRLDGWIAHRVEGLKSGRIQPDELLVHGSRPLLELLHSRGFTLYLASGTDEPFVRKESELLDVARYFGPRIYGAQDDYQTFSKQMVIERILRDNEIGGGQLLSFGDGYVEIENTKAVGGLAVAVASDEANNGSGRMDPWKRQRLLDVGADVVIPDYRDGEALMDCLTGASNSNSEETNDAHSHP